MASLSATRRCSLRGSGVCLSAWARSVSTSTSKSSDKMADKTTQPREVLEVVVGGE